MKKKSMFIILILIVLLASVIYGLSSKNESTKPFKNIKVNEIDNMMVVSDEKRTVKKWSSNEMVDVDSEMVDVINYLKKISINEDNNNIIDKDYSNQIGSITIHFNDSSVKTIYFKKGILIIADNGDANWYVSNIKDSISFDKLYKSLKIEEQPFGK